MRRTGNGDEDGWFIGGTFGLCALWFSRVPNMHFVASGHLFAPVLRPPKQNFKKVFFGTPYFPQAFMVVAFFFLVVAFPLVFMVVAFPLVFMELSFFLFSYFSREGREEPRLFSFPVRF